MICKEVMRKLEERWNPSYALEWDNVGLLVGREEKEIKKIFTALDATEETIAQALEFGADLLITHHPMIFSPVKKSDQCRFYRPKTDHDDPGGSVLLCNAYEL